MDDILTKELDYAWLDRELDRTKSRVFLGSTAGFLAPLMCSCSFYWSEEYPTAWTDGTTIGWNPRYFMVLPEKTRECVLVHELEHVARLDQIRRGGRHPGIWNIACDTRLDNEMKAKGYSFENIFPVELFGTGKNTCENPKYVGWSPEEIYDDLTKKSEQEKQQLLLKFQEDLSDGSGTKKMDPSQLVSTVLAAVQAAKLSGMAGSIPGEVETTLKKFLQPKLPWWSLLKRWCDQLGGRSHSWRRPRRRYHARGLYLPSVQEDSSALDWLIWYFDVSGSVSDDEETRYVSEFKHVFETYRPKRITIVQFDTRIQKVEEYKIGDKFEKFEIHGRGGTSLECVRSHIIENKPTAAIIFSDLFCNPMRKLPKELKTELLWISVNNQDAQVNEGKLIHIKE